MNRYFRGKRILVVGGTGSIGSRIVRQLMTQNPSVIRIFSRDEGKQHKMRLKHGDPDNLRFFIGDIRDSERIHRAMEDIDVVFHCAAMKHVFSCEYNPFEAVRTNVIGTQNVLEAALDLDVEKVIFTSTDKAVNPSNVMGASKLVAERLVTAANNMRGTRRVVFASVRFGNVLFSSGSVIPIFRKQIANGGPVQVTDRRMTRFFMGQRRAVDLVLLASQLARGGEVFVPKMPALRIGDLAEVLVDEFGQGVIPIEEIGIQPGEKLHEELITVEEHGRTVELEHLYVVMPAIQDFISMEWKHKSTVAQPTLSGEAACYSSADQPLLSKQEIRDMLTKQNDRGYEVLL